MFVLQSFKRALSSIGLFQWIRRYFIDSAENESLD